VDLQCERDKAARAALGPAAAHATGEQLRKHARWWLARSFAATLSQYSAVRLNDFGPKIFARWVEEVASSPMPQ
jgi:hypothetical protein